jgi:hypothetical protein
MREGAALLYLLRMGPGSLWGAFKTLGAYLVLRVLTVRGGG